MYSNITVFNSSCVFYRLTRAYRRSFVNVWQKNKMFSFQITLFIQESKNVTCFANIVWSWKIKFDLTMQIKVLFVWMLIIIPKNRVLYIEYYNDNDFELKGDLFWRAYTKCLHNIYMKWKLRIQSSGKLESRRFKIIFYNYSYRNT